MRRIVGLLLVTMLLGGCAVYAEPFPYAGAPAAGVFVSPAPVIIAPAHAAGWHAGWHGGWRHHG
jgi:hypothetical protein